MREVYFISVFIHILAAVAWTGGMVFLAIVLIPAIKNHAGKAMLIHSIGLKFRTIGWIALILLLATGLYNMNFRQVNFSWDELTQTRIGKFILLKLGIFSATAAFSVVHDFYIGTSATKLWMENKDHNKTKCFRMMARWMGRLNLVLSLIAIAIGIAIARNY